MTYNIEERLYSAWMTRHFFIAKNKANVDVADLQSKISILNDSNISLRGKSLIMRMVLKIDYI
jgi:hypothetical protein